MIAKTLQIDYRAGMFRPVATVVPYFALCALLLFTAMPQFAMAKPQISPQFPTIPQQEIAQKVLNYFNGMSTFKADFQQVNPAQGLIQTGAFYLQRPRQFLWQYRSPEKHKLVSTGSRLFFVEGDGGQVTQLPLNTGLAKILTNKELVIDNEVISLLGAEENDKNLNAHINISEDGSDYQIIMSLNKAPLRLAQITVVDALGQKSWVSFTNVTQGMVFPKQMFNYIPPQEEDFLDN